jgi:hypothetical protein
MLIEKWPRRFSEDLSESAIRNHFRPAERYRISRYSYPAGACFSGGMLAGTCFVLAGECSIRFGKDRIHVAEQDIVEVPAGSYSLQVDGPTAVELVFVWELPIVPQETYLVSSALAGAAEQFTAPDRGGIPGSDGSTPKRGPGNSNRMASHADI